MTARTESESPARPALILQHVSSDGPAYLEQWLRRRGYRYELFDTEAGDTFPASLDGYRALAILGGYISVNDERPSLRQAEALIREAVRRGVPIVGHCLGGQLMAKALGGEVRAAPQPEVGWHEIEVRDEPDAREWFGAPGAHLVFQWHYEAFSLPPGARLLAGNATCPHQAFSIGPNLAMQFHVELDQAKLGVWTGERDPTYLELMQRCPTVQSEAAMQARAAEALPRQQALASRIYERWWSLAR